MKPTLCTVLSITLLLSGCCRCDCDCKTAAEATTPESVVSNAADTAERVTYSVDTLLMEEVTEGDFKRNVHILELHTTSQYNLEIYNKITFYALEYLFDYKQVPYAYQELIIDSHVAEKNDILCATALISDPSVRQRWVESQNIYLDLKNDQLLTYEEAAKRVGLDVSKAEAAAETLKKGQSCALYDDSNDTYEVESFFFYENKPYFVLQVTLYMGATYRVTYLYDYETDIYIFSSEGFRGMENALRES